MMRVGILLGLAACGRVGFDVAGVRDVDGGILDDGAPDGVCVDPCALPLQPVTPLDDFNRPDGPLEAPWTTMGPGIRIVGGELELSQYSRAWRTDVVGGAEQWAQITLSLPSFDQETGVFLRAQGADASANSLTAVYHNAGNPHFHIEAWLGDGTIDSLTYSVDTVPGARLRAIARAGKVELYVNEVLLAADIPMSWPDGDAPGLLGVFAYYDNVPARIDDFAGGSCGCQ